MDRNSATSEGGRDRNRHIGRGPRSFKRSDERIQDEVCEMLTRNGEIDADDIDVQVSAGEVTLTGSVPDRSMKHLAENCVERCFGVKEVTNNLRVKKATDGASTSTLSSDTDSSSTKSASSSKKNSTSNVSSTSAPGTSTTNPNH